MPISPRLPSTRPTTRRERIKRDEDSKKHKDSIFLDKNSPTKFIFNSNVAEVFDDMLERSVPLYRECQNLTVNWCKRLATPDKHIYDLGCSTGSLLLLLAKATSTIPRVRLIGVDNSEAMINKAQSKLSGLQNSVDFLKATIDDTFLFNESSTIVMNYTLQFIPVENRAPLLNKIYESLIPGGGFILNEYQVGIYMLAERNPNFWGESYLDAIELHTNVDATARMNAMMAGEYDIGTSVDRKLIELVDRAPGVEVVASASGQHTNLSIMCDRDPTSNNDLRLALKYSIPREQVIQNAFKGYGMIGNDHQVPPTDPFYCDDIPQRAFDPDKARHHLKKSGMEGASIILYTSEQAVSGSEAIALIYAEGAKASGMDLQVQVSPPGSYWSKVWMQVPLCVSGWDARPTADLMLTIANKSDGSWNETAWGSERFDELLVAARGETDAAKRKEMYCEMQRLLHDTGGVGMLGFYDLIDSRRDNVVGFDPHPAGYNRNAFFSTEISFA